MVWVQRICRLARVWLLDWSTAEQRSQARDSTTFSFRRCFLRCRLAYRGEEKRQKTFGSDDRDPCARVANFFSRARRRARLFLSSMGSVSGTSSVARRGGPGCFSRPCRSRATAQQRGSLVLVKQQQQACMEPWRMPARMVPHWIWSGFYVLWHLSPNRHASSRLPRHRTWHPSPSWLSVDLLLRARTMTALLRARCDFRTKKSTAA